MSNQPTGGTLLVYSDPRIPRVRVNPLNLLLLHLNRLPLAVQLDAQAGVKVHVDVGHPDQAEKAQDVSAPIIQQQLEAGEDQEERCHIKAEAELAGEQIEEFAQENVAAGEAATFTEVARL